MSDYPKIITRPSQDLVPQVAGLLEHLNQPYGLLPARFSYPRAVLRDSTGRRGHNCACPLRTLHICIISFLAERQAQRGDRQTVERNRKYKYCEQLHVQQSYSKHGFLS